MTTCILLTAAEADQVRGPSATDPHAALHPVEREGGVFILGVEVLQDVAHRAHWAFLETLPTKDSNDADFPAELPPAQGDTP